MVSFKNSNKNTNNADDGTDLLSKDSSDSIRIPSPDDDLDLALMRYQYRGFSLVDQKVMNESRRTKRINGVKDFGTDHNDRINPKFAFAIKKRVAFLQFFCRNERTGAKTPYVGQALIIRDPKTGLCKFATCLPHLSSTNGNGDVETCLAPQTLTLTNGRSAEICFPHVGQGAKMPHSIELPDQDEGSRRCSLILGAVVNAQTAGKVWQCDPVSSLYLDDLIHALNPFEVISNQFCYEEGLKIGMVVLNPAAGKKNPSMLRGLVNKVKMIVAKVPVFNGKREKVMLYSGSITKVCEKHIEYDVNSFEECTGAVVIVMDQNHPDFGKAIAIHAGNNPKWKSNFGFKLADKFD